MMKQSRSGLWLNCQRPWHWSWIRALKPSTALALQTQTLHHQSIESIAACEFKSGWKL
jgi:hypothetical protein